MKIIALPDLHGSLRHLEALGPHLAEVDVVVLNGNLTMSGTPEEAALLIAQIQRFQPQVWAVPGGYDTARVDQYLRAQMLNLHREGRVFGGAAFIGMGGDLFRTDAPRDHLLYDNVQFEMMLHDVTQTLPRRLPKILVTHYPPYGTQADLTFSKRHIGSRALRTYIEEQQPLACITGWLQDRPAVDTIGRTVILSPGPLWLHRSYGYLELDAAQENIITAEARTLAAEA